MGGGDHAVFFPLCHFAHEGIGDLADGGGLHQVQAAQRLALFADMGEHLRAGRIGNAREVDLEEFGEGAPVIGRVQHAVNIVEHLDLARPRIAGGGAKFRMTPLPLGRGWGRGFHTTGARTTHTLRRIRGSSLSLKGEGILPRHVGVGGINPGGLADGGVELGVEVESAFGWSVARRIGRRSVVGVEVEGG